MSTIESIPISALALAEDNVRKAPVDAAAFAELKASIVAHGLLQNLTVYKAQEPGRYMVTAGGQRMKALQELVAEGVLDTAGEVPCVVVDVGANGRSALEYSLAENAVRVAMHPADQVVAFGRLAEAGADVDAIAARFGLAAETVRKRLKLGALAPALLDKLRAGEISLETAAAFTLTDDHKRQMSVHKALDNDRYYQGVSPHRVRQALTDKKARGDSTLAQYVGQKAYEEAGGALTHDLFPERGGAGVYYDDPELLTRLAGEKLAERGDKIRKQGWKWVEVVPRNQDVEPYDYMRLQKTSEPNEKEAARLAELRTNRREIEEKLGDEDTDEAEIEGLQETHGHVTDEIQTINAAVDKRAKWTAEQKGISGCIVTVEHGGKVRTHEGLVKPEDRKAAGRTTATTRDPDEGRGTSAGDVFRAAGINAKIAEDLRCIRGAATKAELMRNPEVARDLLTFELARGVLQGVNGFDYSASALALSTRHVALRPFSRNNEDEDVFGAASPMEAIMASAKQGFNDVDWLDNKRPVAERWRLFHARPDTYKDQVLGFAVASLLSMQLSVDPAGSAVIEAVTAEINPTFADIRPTQAVLWNRMSTKNMLEVARDVGGEWADTLKGKKKGELAEYMAAVFTDPENKQWGLTSEVVERIQKWAQPGFAPAVDEAETED